MLLMSGGLTTGSPTCPGPEVADAAADAGGARRELTACGFEPDGSCAATCEIEPTEVGIAVDIEVVGVVVVRDCGGGVRSGSFCFTSAGILKL